MVVRLFCNHCDEYYIVDVENVKLVQRHKSEHMKYSNNTYYYKAGCFFKELTQIKRKNA